MSLAAFMELRRERSHKTQQPKAGKTLEGFTPNQRFFLAYARNWSLNVRPEFVRRQVQTAPHSPAKFRVIGPLMNLPEFYQAFGCRKGQAMVRPADQRTSVW